MKSCLKCLHSCYQDVVKTALKWIHGNLPGEQQGKLICRVDFSWLSSEQPIRHWQSSLSASLGISNKLEDNSDIDMPNQIHDDVNRFYYILYPYPKVLKNRMLTNWMIWCKKIISWGHRTCRDEKWIGMLWRSAYSGSKIRLVTRGYSIVLYIYQFTKLSHIMLQYWPDWQEGRQ